VVRHPVRRCLAQAVKRLFPRRSSAVGARDRTGFYYDMELSRQLEPADLEKMRPQMKKAARGPEVARHEWPRAQALEWADERKDPYKRELSRRSRRRGDQLLQPRRVHRPLHRTARAVDGRLKHSSCSRFAGAYCAGDEKRPMLSASTAPAVLDEKRLAST